MLQFLDNFEGWSAERMDASKLSETRDWIAEQRKKRFNNLHKPGKDEYKALTTLALKAGGSDLFKTK